MYKYVSDVEDYTGGLRTITIPAGLLYDTFTVDITDDDSVECSDMFDVGIVSVNGSRVVVGGANNTEVSIMDNDSKCKYVMYIGYF